MMHADSFSRVLVPKMSNRQRRSLREIDVLVQKSTVWCLQSYNAYDTLFVWQRLIGYG